MKIQCDCGEIVHDGTDDLPHKAHVIPDQQWNTLFEALDWLIETRCTTAIQRDEACNQVRQLITRVARTAWQCSACGRLFIEDHARNLHCYPPGYPSTARELLREIPG
ncbi:MAG: hypothetical protein V4689_13275 [Verrucomicrobiota bacterium]